MKLVLNGETKEVSQVQTVTELLRKLDLYGKPIAVELNLKVVSKASFDTVHLTEGDKLEIVQFVGGG